MSATLSNLAATVPDRAAASLASAHLSFADIDRDGRQWAAVLADKGIAHGDRVAVWADVDLAQITLFAALAHLGAVMVPVNPHESADHARVALLPLRPAAIITDGAHHADGLGVADLVGTRHLTFDDLGAAAHGIEDRARFVPVAVAESDAQAIFLTSGSTGAPKGVVLSHRVQWLRSFQGALLEPRGTTVCMFPLFHMAGWLLALGAWQARAHVAFVPRADADTLWSAVEEHDAERLYAIPAVWRRLLDADPDGSRGATLRVIDTGTSATPPSLLSELRDRYPGALRRVFYGSTETGPALMLGGDEVDDHPGTVGRPQPGVSARIGVDGGLEVSSPFLFDGYADDPDSTAAAMPDEWFRTGDLAEVDDHGCWSITGRIGNVIRSGGESIEPSEVEAVIASHPDLSDAAVVGLADPEWGEIVTAVVVPCDGIDLDLQMLDSWCRDQLAPHKVPRRFEIARSIPRTDATGQIRRPLIVEMIEAHTEISALGTGP